MSLVTINTDASFSQKYNRGGYGFWIAWNGKRFTGSGEIDLHIVSSHQAEMIALVQALELLYLELPPTWVRRIVINTDSMFLIQCLKGQPAVHKRYSKTRARLWELLRFFNAEIDARHVKAHQHTDTARNWVNAWCDQQAKKNMRHCVAKIVEGRRSKNHARRARNKNKFKSNEERRAATVE